MSQYNPVTPTIQGQAMIAESLRTEEGLVFTKVEWGDGIVSGGEQYPTFTALKNKVIESPISKMERQDATLYITSVVNNSTLSTGFYCREIGVWAKIGDNGTEQLFAYTYAENASYTPSSNQYNEKRVRIGLGVDANVNVTIKFNSEVYLTRQELEDHNTDPTAHEDIRQKFNDYATKTGTGATGTWGINISGNAATATKATQDGNGNIIADTYLKKSGDTVTGTLNVPTQDATDNSTKVANTAFVQSAVSKLVNSAPATLDTLNELATALGNDPNFATTVTNMISQKADNTVVDNIVNVMYPVGIIVEFAENVDPNATWVGTTWERMSSGRVLVSAGQYNESEYSHNYTLGETGGEATHQLTVDEMPSHNHRGETNWTGDHQHNSGWGEDSPSNAPYGVADSNTGYWGSASSDRNNRMYKTSIAGGHSHNVTIDNTGSNLSHNNIQPYIVVNRWKRTA